MMNKKLKPLRIIVLIILTNFNYLSAQNNYEIGVGISDVTGQIAESNFFGYAKVFFRNAGIKDRQYSRAFIVKDNENSVVFVSVDKGAMFQSVNQAVLENLAKKYGNTYTDENVIISATHTHVSPGGQSFYKLYDTSSGGFNKVNFDIMVNGIVQSIEQAHNNLAPGRIYYNSGSLTNASINRSLVAYKANKDAKDFPSVDEEMTVLKFIQGNKAVGMLSWFAVHPVSLSQNYKFCSGDNKGFAALKFERAMQSSYKSDEHLFVAAFSNTNAGDMSPNVAYMPNSSEPFKESKGPGKNEEESREIIGNRQYNKAVELYNTATEQLIGSVKAITRYNDFSDTEIAGEFTNGKVQHTCRAALGVAFRAGAEDGRSGLGTEGQVNKHPHGCQGEKVVDILFNLSGNNDDPQTPKILPNSIMKIGQLGILAAPGEFTIMAGRRSKAEVAKVKDTGLTHLIFAGYSDAYVGYITTREEYATQQYEGGSTHFGPWTCAAYRQEFSRLAKKLVDPNSDPWGYAEPTPPTKNPASRSIAVNILFDDKPLFKKFGDVYKDVKNEYSIGETVQVVFWGGHPNHNTKTNDTYLKVDKWNGQEWKTEYQDRDTNTKLEWKRYGIAKSKIIIDWKITPETSSGFYRITHSGIWKNGWNGKLSPYNSESGYFYVHGNYTSKDNIVIERPTKQSVKSTTLSTLVYPNPSNNGDITILNNLQKSGIYEIRNTLGKLLQSGKVNKDESKNKITIKGNSGLYLINITYEDGSKKQGFIIKK